MIWQPLWVAVSDRLRAAIISQLCDRQARNTCALADCKVTFYTLINCCIMYGYLKTKTGIIPLLSFFVPAGDFTRYGLVWPELWPRKLEGRFGMSTRGRRLDGLALHRIPLAEAKSMWGMEQGSRKERISCLAIKLAIW